jgi:hypothetical protein
MTVDEVMESLRLVFFMILNDRIPLNCPLPVTRNSQRETDKLDIQLIGLQYPTNDDADHKTCSKVGGKGNPQHK